MILHTQPSDPWIEEDFLLLEAFQILEQERCGQCGLPRYICHTSDTRVRFDIHEDTCEAKYEVERHEENLAAQEGYKAPLGTVMVPRPWMSDRSDFAELRDDYYRAEVQRESEIAEARPDF